MNNAEYAEWRGELEKLKNKNGYIKTWQFIIGVIVTLGSVFMYVGSAKTTMEQMQEDINDLKKIKDKLIELGVDINYIKRDVADIKEKIKW